MGCSSSSAIEKPYPRFVNNTRRNPFKSEKIKYNKHHEILETLFLNSNFKQDCMLVTEKIDFDTFFNKIYAKWQQSFDEYGLAKAEARDTLLQISTEEIIHDHFQKNNCNVNEWILTIIENMDTIKEEKIDIIKSLIFSLNRYYPFSQKAIVLYYPGDDLLGRSGLKPLVANLKFKQDYKSQIFVIWFSRSFFDKEETIIDICEIIENNNNLTTVLVLLNFEEEEKLLDESFTFLIKNLKFIFNTIKANKNIIAVLFANMAEDFINIPIEVLSSFIYMLCANKLLFFGLSKIMLNKELLDALISHVSRPSSLKLVLLDLKCEGSYIDNIISAFVKNRNLIGAIIGTIPISDTSSDAEDLENRIKVANPNIKFFHYQKNFKIPY